MYSIIIALPNCQFSVSIEIYMYIFETFFKKLSSVFAKKDVKVYDSQYISKVDKLLLTFFKIKNFNAFISFIYIKKITIDYRLKVDDIFHKFYVNEYI